MTAREAVRLARAEDAENVIVAAPFPFLEAVRAALHKSTLGAQDVFYEAKGAYTGQVAPPMLRSLGVRYVIIGHSERRYPPAGEGETDAVVRKKIEAVFAEKLAPILCVGEPWNVRKKGLAAAKRFVLRQLRTALRGIEKLKIEGLIIAYEPVWAISTGKADEPAETAEMARFIKKSLKTKNYKPKTIRVLYGGSVTSRNAEAFLEEKDVDGVLVGRASLKAASFGKIITAASLKN